MANRQPDTLARTVAILAAALATVCTARHLALAVADATTAAEPESGTVAAAEPQSLDTAR